MNLFFHPIQLEFNIVTLSSLNLHDRIFRQKPRRGTPFMYAVKYKHKINIDRKMKFKLQKIDKNLSISLLRKMGTVTLSKMDTFCKDWIEKIDERKSKKTKLKKPLNGFCEFRLTEHTHTHTHSKRVLHVTKSIANNNVTYTFCV